MNEQDLERQLRDAFDAQARASVSDSAVPPGPRFAQLPATRSRRARLLAPLAAAAAVVAVVAAVLAIQQTRDHGQRAAHAASATPTAALRSSAARDAPVRIRIYNSDGATYGVGMPVIAYFSKRFASAKPLASATSVTVNGKPVRAAWFFERPSANGPIEGHLRMPTYWPAHSDVRVAIAANDLTPAASVQFHTGARTLAVVENAEHRMILTQDGKPLGVFPVSLGTPTTPTYSGIKVIMAKRLSVRLRGAGFDETVDYSEQLTDSGEYIFAAPWNIADIKAGLDSSNGCTNLLPRDARFVYRYLQVGDVVEYPDASGTRMPSWDGYGDWNVPWRIWRKGGLIPTS